MYQEDLRKDNDHEYVDVGPRNGQTLLLLHGLFGTASNFEALIQRFRGMYRVVLPILPIFSMPLHEVSLKGLMKYLKSFVDYLKLDDFHLIGNSLGGHLTLLYILSGHRRVRSMVLTGSSGLYESAFGSTVPKRDSYEYVHEKMKLTFYDPSIITKEMVDEVFGIVNNRLKAIRIVKMAKSAIRNNIEKELHGISQPSLLVWGKNDNITPLFVGEKFNELLPDSELVVLDHCGHAPMLERPDEFNDALEKFLLTESEKSNTLSSSSF